MIFSGKIRGVNSGEIGRIEGDNKKILVKMEKREEKKGNNSLINRWNKNSSVHNDGKEILNTRVEDGEKVVNQCTQNE